MTGLTGTSTIGRVDESQTEPAHQIGSGWRGGPASLAATRALRSAWLPSIVVILITTVALKVYGVPVGTTLVFLVYLTLGISLPGTLLWRAAQRRSGWFVADVAAGSVLGYAVEVLVYIPARAVGAPLLVLVYPVATVTLFLSVRGLRRFWRGSGRAEDRTPVLWAWSVAVVFLIVLFWSCISFFRVHALAWPFMSAPDADSPFHLALIGEAKHHMPLMSPWLPDEPVFYHWFVYAEMAATSWVTGIEPQILLLRLSLLPMLAALAVLVAVIARRLTRQWWTGPAAAAATFLVLAPNPYPWPLHAWFSTFATSPYDDGSSFRLVLWTSPTHTFGTALFAGLVLVLIGIITGEERGPAQWALASGLTIAVMGAKATFLPILLAALLAVVAVHLVVSRRWHLSGLVAAALTLGCVLFAQFVLFGGASQGLAIDPLHQMRISGGPYTTGFTTAPNTPRWTLLLAAALTLLCWMSVWAGIGALFFKRRLLDPAITLLLGIGAAGMAGILLFGHEGGAEGWFLLSSRPYLSLASVVGVASITATRQMTWRVAAAMAGAGLLGAVVVRVERAFGSTSVPTMQTEGGARGVAIALVWPYLVLVLAVAAFAFLLWRSRRAQLRGIRFALVVSMLAGFGVFAAFDHVVDSARNAADRGWRNVRATGPYITWGTLEAGRWLRDHSNPDDLVATNAHCLPYPGTPAGRCDNRHFAMAAYSERRFLIEGWGFTNASHVYAKQTRTPLAYGGYWDAPRLADNDAVFTAPSAQTIGRLCGKYGVRWLFVDESVRGVSPNLGRFVALRFHTGRSAIYELPC